MHDHETPLRRVAATTKTRSDGGLRPRGDRPAPLAWARQNDLPTVTAGSNPGDAPTGERVFGLTVGVTQPRGRVLDEREVRAAAGLTMLSGAVAFSYAYFDKQYVPLQVVASLFFLEFLIRVTVGLRYSPFGVLAHAMTLGRAPEWVSARPKRFAWTLGLAMAFAMTVITNSGIRGYLPRTMCLICLLLMWMESALGLCLGCQIHSLIDRRRRTASTSGGEACTDCADQPPAQTSLPGAPEAGRTFR